MNKAVKMVSTIKYACACVLGVFAFTAGAVTVTDIQTTTHYPWNGKVDISYRVGDIVNESSYALKVVVRADRDYVVRTETVSENRLYKFTWDAAAANFTGRVEKAQVIVDIASPAYAIVDLTRQVQGQYPISYRTAVDATSDEYKKDKLLLKLVASGGVTNFVGVYEVTQAQYERVMGMNPSYFSEYSDKSVEAQRPVERVSYETLTQNGFFAKLCARTDNFPFTLPSGADWQAAACGPSVKDKSAATLAKTFDIGAPEQTVLTGRSKEDNVWLPTIGRYVDLWDGTTKKANGNANANRYSDETKGTDIVGSSAINGNGLYDMHGNVAEWTTDGGDGYHVLRGGSWQDSDANCAIGATWAYPDKDTSQLNRIGFRVFAKVQDAAVLQPVTRASDKFPLDVAVGKTRYLTVVDNAGTPVFTYYPIYYYQTTATSRGWVTFDEGDKDWRPTKQGTNEVTFAGEKAYFYVKPLEVSFTVTNKTVVYNGQPQTIKPDIAAPAVGCEVLYWCKDVPGQATEDEAKTNLIEFTGVKYDDQLEVTNRVINFKITSDFYSTAATNALLTIEPRAITNAVIKLVEPSPIYTGSVMTQTIDSVTVDGIEYPLEEGRDYTVSGNTATQPGVHTMTLTGVSNFVGSVSTNWTLATKGIETAKIVFDKTDLIYNGREQVKKIEYVTMKIGGKSVRVKYEVVDNSNTGTNAAEYVCTVKGKTPFSGVASNTWEILKCSITNAVATGTTNFVYNGMPQEIVRSNVTTVQCPDVTGTVADYTVACDAKTDVGAYNYTVTANDPNYKDQSTNNVWTISPRALSNVTFTVYGTYFYNGSAHKPTAKDIVATDGGLSEGAQVISTNDWTVTGWGENTNAGEGTVMLTGANNYDGTATAKFTISPTNITSLTLIPTNFIWTGQWKTPTATVVAGTVTLTAAEYTLEGNTSEKDVGRYSTTAKANGGNFSGSSAPVAWTIVPTAPEITWMGYDKATKKMTKQATTNQTDFPVFEYATKSQTVTFNALGPDETLKITAWTNCFDTASQTNVWAKYDGLKISDNRTRITCRTRLSAFATKVVPTGVLTGAVSTVELVPGQCCDPKIYVTGKDLPETGATNYYHNAAKVVIARTNTVGGGNEPLDPEGGAWTNSDGVIYFTLLGSDGQAVGDVTNKYDVTNGFTISSDAVKVIAWIKGQNRLDSIVVTQELARVIESFDAPKIRIESIPGHPSAERRITIARDFVGDEAVPFGPGTNVYYTIDRKVGEMPNALEPMALQGSASDRDWTTNFAERTVSTFLYTGPTDITLAVGETNQVKAIAYVTYEDGKDFFGRSAVAVTNSVRGWTIGDALDAPDQEFYNGTNTVVGKYSPTNTLWTRVLTNADFKAYGPDCMRSGVLTKEGETSSLTTLVKGPGLLVFNWKANCVADIDPSQKNWDHGEFWLDGKLITKIDGTNECWTTVTNILDNSVEQHTLTWTYVKVYPTQEGGVIPPGEDCVYLDKFVWRPAPTLAMLDGQPGPSGHVYGTTTVDDLVWDNTYQVPTKTATTNYIHLTRNVYGANDEFLFTTNLVEGVDFTVDVKAMCAAGTTNLMLVATTNTTLITGSNKVEWVIQPIDITDAVVVCDQTNFTYTGTAQGPTMEHLWVKHYLHAEPLDFVGNTGSYDIVGTANATAAGSYSFNLVGKTNMTGETADCNWKIGSKALIGNISAGLEYTETTYNREEQQPKVYATNTVSGVALVEGTDYTLAWPENCTTAGVKTVTLTALPGSGYTGSTNLTYTIKKAVIQSFEFNGASKIEYSGKEVTVDARNVKTDNGLVLDKTEWAFEDNGKTTYHATDVGEYTAAIKSLDTTNIVVKSGGVSQSWEIYKKDIADGCEVIVTLSKDIVYTGNEQTITNGEPTGVTVKLSGTEFKLTDYSFDCVPQKNAGKHTAKVTANDPNFKGSANVEWEIVPRDIANVVITLTTNLVWNGEAEWAITNTTFTRRIKTPATEQAQTFTVTDGGKELTLDTDYTIDGASNKGTDAGSYTLTIKGKGNYDSATTATKAWTIAPTVPMISPNKLVDPSLEEQVVITGVTRVAVGRDVDSWGIKWKRTTVSTGETKTGVSARNTATTIFTLDGTQRTTLEAHCYVKGQEAVTSAVAKVDYVIGSAATPVVVLAYTNNVPMVDGFGNPCTNEIGYVITNFCHNGQLVALTRGNVVVSNDVAKGVYQAYTNDADNAMYTDGTLRYTLDGTLPTETSAEWTAGSKIAISNTTTVIAKVFGKEYADSAYVTNVFVREYENYAPPMVTYQLVGETGWATATTDRVEFKVAGLKARVADTNELAVSDTTRTIWCVTNSCEKFAYPADGFTFDGTVKLVTWIADANGEYASSPTNTVEFSMDDTLSAPVIAFYTNDVATAQYIDWSKAQPTFTNAYQWICITNAGEVFTKDTDGEIWFKTNSAPFAKYERPFQIWKDTTVEAFKTNSVYGLKSSETNTVEFKQQMASLDKPVVTINPTITVKYFEVVISNMVEDASDYVTYYTLDGTEPVGINGAGKTPSTSFTGAAFTNKVYVAAGSNLVVKAKAFREVNGNTDFIAMSSEGTASTNRVVTIGDYLRPGAEEEQTEAPSTADLDAVSKAGDGYNSIWTNDYDVAFDTSWTNDDVVAYTNDVGGVTGGKSMRSGSVRDAVLGVEGGTNSVMTAKVFGPGTFTFYWKASTEFEPEDYENNVFDFCDLTVDGEPTGDFIYGTNDWTKVTFTIKENGCEPTEHTIMWNYVKDAEQYDDWELFGTDPATGEPLGHIEDCVWVDEFVWTASAMMDQCDIYPEPLTYNQAEQFPTFYVTNRVTGAALTNGVDYTVETNKQTKAGTYTAVLKGRGTTYTGTNTVEWTIAQLSITNAVVTLDATNLVYDVTNQTVNVRKVVVPGAAADGSALDVTEEGWTVSGNSRTAHGNYTLTVTANPQGNLKDEVKVTWTIDPRPLASDMITLGDKLTYAGGAEQTQDFSVSYNTETLVAGSHYTIVSGNTGTTVTGSVIKITAVAGGNYTNSAEKAWTMNQLDITGGTAMLSATNLVYTGKEQTVALTNLAVTLQGWGANPINLTNELWTITGTNGTNVCTYTVTVTPDPKGNLKGGPVTQTWQIVPASLSDVTVVLGSPNTYNGTVQKQEIVSVTHSTIGALSSNDYTVENNSTNVAGKFKMTLKGTGNWTGEKTVDWEQLPALIDSITFNPASYVYDGTEKTPAITVKAGELVAKVGTDFTTNGTSSATLAGTNTVTVKGSYDPTKTGAMGNFKVPTENLMTNVTWVIKARGITNGVAIALSYTETTYNRKEQKPNVYATNTVSGVALVEGTDYTLSYSDNCTTAGVKTVTFTGKDGSGYTGSTNLTYTITPAVVKSFEINGASKIEYSGEEITVDARNVKTENNLVLDKTEYALDGNRATNVGKYTASVKSTSGNFKVKDGGVSKPWEIYAKDIAGCEVVVGLAKDIVYTAGSQTIEAGDVTSVTADGVEVKNYTISCGEQKNAGKHTAKVTANDPNFKGTADVEWEIKPRSITGATITYVEDPVLWTGSDVQVQMKELAVDGLTFSASDTTFAYEGDKATDAGTHVNALTVTGSDNFKDKATGTWRIKPTAPTIKPNNGGKYSAIVPYITVEIARDCDDWTVEYTTNGTDWVVYPLEGAKFDIEKRMTVQARAISADGTVTSDVQKVSYYFGVNVDPMVALYAADTNAVPTDAETKGAGDLIVVPSTDDPYTNFYHSAALVNLTRFGTMTAEEIVVATNDTTYIVGDKPVCPYTDGEVWYTVAEGDAAIVAPTNDYVGVSKRFDPADKSTWPEISTNATIVAQVFGCQLENGLPITNVFNRIWTKMPAPDMTASVGTSFQFTNVITLATNNYVGVDRTVTNGMQKLYYTLDGKVPTKNSKLYTGPISLTWKDCDANGKVSVQAISYYGEDYLASDVVSNEYTHFTTKYTTPTMTPSATFHHRNDEFGDVKGYEVALTNMAPTEADGELQWSYDGENWTKYTDPLWVTDTTNVCARVAATDGVHDYTTSDVITNTFTYAPYQYNAPVLDKSTDYYTTPTITFKLSRPAAPECGDGGVVYYTLDGSDPASSSSARQSLNGDSKTFTTNATVTIRAIMVDSAPNKDHLDSAEANATYTRVLDVSTVKVYLVDADGKPIMDEKDPSKYATNFWHKANLKMETDATDVQIVYESAEIGSGTYTTGQTIPVSNSFKVAVKLVCDKAKDSATATNAFTRLWETLGKPKILLKNPEGVATNVFRHSGDTVLVSNRFEYVKHTAELWPTNATIKIAMGDEPTAADWFDYVEGMTILTTNEVAVWAAVEAEDYLSCTNNNRFVRNVDALDAPEIDLDNSDSRTNVVVTFALPEGANTIWYTYAVTNDDAEVELVDPVGEEYDKYSAAHLASKVWTNGSEAVNIAIKPHQQVFVKAVAYFEEDDGVPACTNRCFTGKSAVTNEAISLEWTLADGLDVPDWKTFTVTSSKREGSTAEVVEDDEVKNFGDSSVRFEGVADSQWLSVETTVIGPGTVVFDWKTNCEKGPHDYNYDHMTFYVNGTPICKRDGSNDWQTVTNRINGGMLTKNVLKWVYEKDDSEHGKTADLAWLDHFQWIEGETQLEITEDLDDWAYEYLDEYDYWALYNPDGSPNTTQWKQMLAQKAACNDRTYWECYVLGLDPTDTDAKFVITAPVLNEQIGTASVTFVPRMAGRTYTLVGKKSLNDVYWADLAVINATVTELGKPTTIKTEVGVIASEAHPEWAGYKYFTLRVKMAPTAK